MAKFRVGDGQTTSTLPQPVSPARTQQVKGKQAVAKTTAAQAAQALDATEAPTASDRTGTEGLRNQVKAGLKNLEQAYYGGATGSNLLAVMGAPASTEADPLPAHVVAHHAKQFASELGLDKKEAEQLVSDLAAVLA